MKNGLFAKGTSPRLVTGALLSIILLAGCDEHITVVRDTSIAIPQHATWAWRPAPPPPKNPVISRDVIKRNGTEGETVAREESADTETLRLQIKIGIERAMGGKGFVRVDDPQAADFLVDYHAGVHRHNVRVAYAEPYPVVVCGYWGCWNTYGGGYWGPPGVGYETIRYREGTIVFDLTKRTTGRLAFRAVGFKQMNRPTFSQENINDAVHHLLHDLKPGK
jgi:uncharacterized protein DUF4136